MVFQSYALYPHMTVFENMAFALKLRKLPKATIADKVRRAADVLGHRQRAGQAPQAALGRATPARRARARNRARAAVLPVRRAAVEPGREAARRDARGDQAAAPGARQHHGLRHARPGRGDHARRSRGRDEGRASCSSARARSTSTTTRPTGSSPGFLGTPPMNFFEGRLVDEGGRLWFDEGTRQAARARAGGVGAARAGGGRRRRRAGRAPRGAGAGVLGALRAPRARSWR